MNTQNKSHAGLSNLAVTRLSKFVASQDELQGGLGDDAQTTDFSDEQVTKGIKVEMEHTDDPGVAREIVLDHLTEDPRYYDHLEDMETTMKSATEYKGEQTPKYSQVIDPVEQMFDYVVGQLDIMLMNHKEDPDGARTQEYANALEAVMDILDPFV